MFYPIYSIYTRKTMMIRISHVCGSSQHSAHTLSLAGYCCDICIACTSVDCVYKYRARVCITNKWFYGVFFCCCFDCQKKQKQKKRTKKWLTPKQQQTMWVCVACANTKIKFIGLLCVYERVAFRCVLCTESRKSTFRAAAIRKLKYRFSIAHW